MAVKEGGADPMLADQIAQEHPLPVTVEIRASSEQAMSPAISNSTGNEYLYIVYPVYTSHPNRASTVYKMFMQFQLQV